MSRDFLSGSDEISPPSPVSSGVGVIIFYRSRLPGSFCHFDVDGRVIVFSFFFGSQRYRVVSVYAPAITALCTLFFDALRPCCVRSDPLILCGDFNCVCDSIRDVRCPGQGRPTWNARELKRLAEASDMSDAWLVRALVPPGLVMLWQAGLTGFTTLMTCLVALFCPLFPAECKLRL